MNYIVMVYGSAVAFCQDEETARRCKPDLPGAAIYQAAGVMDEDEVVEIFGRPYIKLP